MKAIILQQYGQADQLQLEEVEQPTPKEFEVLIQVHAVSLNDWDWGLLRGKPFVNRVVLGLFKPKKAIIGMEVSGLVTAIGTGVTQWKIGDEVFGDLCNNGFGGLAEYACAHEKALALKPSNLTFEQAAALPQCGLIALQGLAEKIQIQKGQKILINGAGGGTGSYALQLAKSYGAQVTGVDNEHKLALMTSLGADHVIDYRAQDFTKNGQTYDVILDLMAYHSIFDYRRALAPKGVYIATGGSSWLLIRLLLVAPLLSLFSSKKMSILIYKPNQGLDRLKELFAAGTLVPIIDRVFPLSGAPEAMEYFGEGLAKGKLVITMSQEKSQVISKA